VICLYLESFGNPRKFSRLARRTGRSKPIVAVKSGHGRTVAGLTPSSSDLPETTVAALFEAAGVIRVATWTRCSTWRWCSPPQPLPAGDRIAVVGNSLALAVLVAEAAAAEGLMLTRSVDTGVNAAPAEFGAAVQAALASDDVDAAVIVFVPPAAGPVCRRLRHGRATRGRGERQARHLHVPWAGRRPRGAAR
jgi:hypothetical protein